MDKNAKERLNEVYRHLFSQEKISSQKSFAEAIRVQRTALSAALNGNSTYLTKNLFIKICAAFPGIFNIDYLLTGKGQLLLDSTDAQLVEASSNMPVRSTVTGKPYYNVDFTLGFDIMFNDQTQNPDYLIDFPPFNDCDCWCNAHGNSMFPTIASGDIVALKQIRDISYLINGEIYAIVTSNGLRTIKRIRDNGSTFTLIADNKEVGDQDIPKSLVTHAFHVRATFRIL